MSSCLMQGYNSLKDFFPTMEMRPNPQCSNFACMERQVRNSDPALVHPIVEMVITRYIM